MRRRSTNETGHLKPLLDIRWVCATCLFVLHAPLKLTKRWIGNGTVRNYEIMTADGPRHCGKDMLLAGEPKVDRYGSGLVVDPVDNLRMPV